MPLSSNTHGKGRVCVRRVDRGTDRHAVHDLTVHPMVVGGYAAADTVGDNVAVVATDITNTPLSWRGHRQLGGWPAWEMPNSGRRMSLSRPPTPAELRRKVIRINSKVPSERLRTQCLPSAPIYSSGRWNTSSSTAISF